MHWRYLMAFAALAGMAACSKAPSVVEVEFVATYAGSPVSCQQPASVSMTDLRFYVHKLRFEDANGRFHPVRLAANDWQQPDLAFLDLEDGSGSCQNGTSVTNSRIQGTVSGENFRALEFTLGVPFDRNHGDPLLAEPPLGDADMHWHWRGGYKFLRAGVRSDSDGFWLHLGSTGCAGTIRNITSCSAPNRVAVRLEGFALGDAVAVDLAALAAAGMLGDATPTDCSSGPAEQHCAAAFAALGLSHAGGAPSGGQQLFSIRRTP
jgi:uncharacterized repeat protein (TIGR04052 family)